VISNINESLLDKAFDSHMRDLLLGYNLIVFLNLLSKEKEQEN